MSKYALGSVVVHGIESGYTEIVRRSATANICHPANSLDRNPTKHTLHKLKEFHYLII